MYYNLSIHINKERVKAVIVHGVPSFPSLSICLRFDQQILPSEYLFTFEVCSFRSSSVNLRNRTSQYVLVEK